jgi:predicted restriction endonuclease
VNRRNYDDPLYKDFRRKVLSRDKHKCQWYGCNSKKRLNVHHIKRWVDCPGLRFDINNGITLCRAHHDMIKGDEHVYESVFFKIVANNAKR